MNLFLETDGDVVTEVENGNTNSTSGEPQKKKQKRTNQLIKWDFVWNNYPQNYVETLETVFSKICTKYLFENEIGEENGTPHIQGAIWLKKPMRWEEFGLPIQISYRPIRNERAVIDYCRKDYDNNVPGCVLTIRGFPAELKIIKELRPFQQDLVNFSQLPPNDRKILYIYDEEGDKGKTQFTKYMVARYNALFCTGGRYEDMTYLLAAAQKNGRDLNIPFTFILNVPRDVSSDHISYKALEAIKDGLMTSPKYESTSLVFNSPHVWVFSNSPPNLDKLSADKWELYTINILNQLIPYNPYNTPEDDRRRETSVWEID